MQRGVCLPSAYSGCAKKDGKWGAIDKTGATVVPFEYDDMSVFRDGVAYGVKGGGLYAITSQSAGMPMHRLCNEPANNHNYTASREEHDSLLALGWADEGYAWYGV